MLTEDVCVPITQVPAMLQRIEAIAVEHDVLIANIAHAGDGNLHPLLITEPGDEAARLRAQQAFAAILVEALALGGTVTGEHGVGLAKRARAWRPSSRPPWWTCTARCGRRSTPTRSSTRARSSPTDAQALATSA